jgi:regulator of RNase E activity RraB
VDLLRRKQRTAAKVDRATLATMEKAGMDLSTPLTIEHFLYFPSQESAGAVAGTLIRDGYDATAEAAAESPANPWLVFATRKTMLNESSVGRMRDRLETLAAEYGGEYDGWGSPGK